MFLKELKIANFRIIKIKGNSMSLPFLPAKYAGNIKIIAKKEVKK